MQKTKKIVTKNEIANNITKVTGIPISNSLTLINDFVSEIVDTTYQHGKVSFKNFGKFELKRKKARAGRNPKTGKEYLISSRYVISFTASSRLKKMVKENISSNA